MTGLHEDTAQARQYQDRVSHCNKVEPIALAAADALH